MMNYEATGIINDVYWYGMEDIIKDIDNLEKRNYKAVYGELHKNVIDNMEYGYCLVPLIPFLDELKVDRELSLLFHLMGYEYYGDIYDMFDGWDDVTFYDTINTYNYESHNERILQYTLFDLNGTTYIALEIQDGISDARYGYSPLYIFEYEGDIDYIHFMLNSYTIYINGLRFDIEYDTVISREGDYMDIHPTDFLERIYNVSLKVPLHIELWGFEY